MSVELLREADLILSACGRPVAPPGVRWVDIPGALVFQTVVLGTGEPETPANGVTQLVGRLVNTYPAPFLIRGFLGTEEFVDCAFRVIWPDGRYVQRTLTPIGFESASGPRQFTIFPEVQINPGDRIKLEFNRSLFPPDTVNLNVCLAFNGAIRFLLTATGAEPPQPLPDLSLAPRIRSGPNQNIMVPEFWQGDQCYPETPPGFWDEVFLLQSDLVEVPTATLVPDQVLRVPGDCAEFIGRHITFTITADEAITVGRPIFNFRLPTGYAITGGDFVTDQIAGPIFPELVAPGGGRILFDVSTEDTDQVEEGSFFVRVNIHGCKRRAI